jgi:drug/metabolite transporter (DMT)-like permease
MSALGQLLFPIGVFITLVGVVLVTNSPFMKDILNQVEFLQKNKRLLGAVLAIFGLMCMALSISA